MPTSPRIGLPYPAENSDPWFESFVGLVEAVDSSLYASREDRNIVLMGGGTIGFTVDPLTNLGTLSWSSSLFLSAAATGFLWGIAAGSVTLADGQCFYTTLTRSPTENTTVLAASGGQVPSSDSDILIGFRKGGIVYFRNGMFVQDGDSLGLFNSRLFGFSGEALQRQIPIAINEVFNTPPDPYTNYGYIYFDPSKHDLTGTTKSLSFDVTAYVDSGVTGLIKLYDTTNTTDLVELTITSTTPAHYTSTFTLTGSGRILEVDMRISSGTGALNCCWAGVLIENQF